MEETTQVTSPSRQQQPNTRTQGSGHASSMSGSQPGTANSVLSGSSSSSNAGPAAGAAPASTAPVTSSIVALPRVLPSTPVAGVVSANGSTSGQSAATGSRPATNTTSSPRRSSASIGNTRVTPITMAPNAVAASASSSNRRDGAGTGTSTAASHLSTQSNSAVSSPSVSLFGFLGSQRQGSDDSPAAVGHPYGWRAMSASNAALNSSNNNTSSNATAAANMTNSSNQSQNSHFFSTPSTQRATSNTYQTRPAITSFLGNASSGNTASWNGNQNPRSGAAATGNGGGGATVGALQQQHSHHNSNIQHQPHLTGSPARHHAIVSGTSSPWMGSLHGQNSHSSNNTTIASSAGWTLADPAAWSGGATITGRICSGFEENQIVAFTWLIPEASLLRDEVEKSPLPSEGGRSISAGAGKSEVWTTQPIFGDGKWKLELVRTTRLKSPNERGEVEEEREDKNNDDGADRASDSITVLSVYLTSMVLDYSPPELEIPATIMIGIKPVQSQAQTSRSGSWLWRKFINYVFRRESEYYECHDLPTLSELLQDSDIQRLDAFSLTIQISTGPRAATKALESGVSRPADANQASPFVVKDNQLVHHSLISGLERLLDCKSTGDVLLIVRERGLLKRTTREDGGASEEVWSLPVGVPIGDWAQSAEEGEEGQVQVVVRDRCLWAHSSILCARSEFFSDMLQSNFAEGQEQSLSMTADLSGEMQLHGRRVKTLRIVDADFATIYWLLRYLYLEEVEFVPSEDVRSAALDDDWMTMGLPLEHKYGHQAVWNWTPLSQLESANERAATQQKDMSTASQGDHPLNYHFGGAATQPRSASRHASQSMHSPSSKHANPTPTSPDLSRGSNTQQQQQQAYNSYQRRTPSDLGRYGSIDPGNSSNSVFTSAQPPSMSIDSAAGDYQPLHLDPQEHPCSKAFPASALALYKLAHRYHQQELLRLAEAHLISSLTPQSAFQTLLATHLYADLYEHVKAYVLDKWDLVSHTSEFEQCCDEVSAGEWGVEAGKTLRVFMRSLMSPTSRAR